MTTPTDTTIDTDLPADLDRLMLPLKRGEYPDCLRLPRRAAFVEQMREGQANSDELWKKEQKES